MEKLVMDAPVKDIMKGLKKEFNLTHDEASWYASAHKSFGNLYNSVLDNLAGSPMQTEADTLLKLAAARIMTDSAKKRLRNLGVHNPLYKNLYVMDFLGYSLTSDLCESGNFSEAFKKDVKKKVMELRDFLKANYQMDMEY